jgi:L-amino acid N-acyltransferase YncA
MEFLIRGGTLEDSIGIAKVHLQTWQKSYRKFFPQEKLDNYSIPKSAKNWKTRIESYDRDRIKLLVAEDFQKRIIGFATGGPSGVYEKSGIAGSDCEVYAIYVLNDCQNKGIGTALIKEMIIYFLQIGWKSMIIWTLKESCYRTFYEKLGGTPQETKLYHKWDTEHILSGYVWEDISLIAI